MVDTAFVERERRVPGRAHEAQGRQLAPERIGVDQRRRRVQFSRGQLAFVKRLGPAVQKDPVTRLRQAVRDIHNHANAARPSRNALSNPEFRHFSVPFAKGGPECIDYSLDLTGSIPSQIWRVRLVGMGSIRCFHQTPQIPKEWGCSVGPKIGKGFRPMTELIDAKLRHSG
jgi:hypothetical protein